MTWHERLVSLDESMIRKTLHWLASQYRLFERGLTIDSLMVDTLYKSWEKYDQYDSLKGSFQVWVRNWAYHVCIQYWRETKHLVPTTEEVLDMIASVPDSRPQPLEQIIRAEEIVHAQQLVTKIEIAIHVIGGRSRKTDLLVLQTYRRLLRTTDKHVTRLMVAEIVGLSDEGVRKSMRRIRDKCEMCGVRI